MGFRSLFFRKKTSKSSAKSPDRSQLGSRSSSATTPTHADELELVFKKFDVNGDGKISAAELGSIMESLRQPTSDEELQKMVREVDKDGDGFIDLDEFIELNTKGVDSDEVLMDLKGAFSVYDIDGNGSISAEELHKVLRSLGDECSVAECKKMIGGVDVNGDGLISFDEFKAMMTMASQRTNDLKIE